MIVFLDGCVVVAEGPICHRVDMVSIRETIVTQIVAHGSREQRHDVDAAELGQLCQAAFSEE